MHPFHALSTHRMVRVAAATPRGTVGDSCANADAAIALARQAHDRGVDLLVFPELNLSSYAIDDLHLQSAQQAADADALARVVEASHDLAPLMLLGVAVPRNGRLYNCAVAVHRGRVLGAVPKTYLPNYREYYEKRWFASGAGLTGLTVRLAGREIPFGTDLLFEAADLPGFVVHAEVCEDFWAPLPPSTFGALAGATVCCNLSASNIVVGKARERAMLCASQSARTLSAYVYAASGPGESTTDVAWDGQGLVYELGEPLAAGERFAREPGLTVADIDLERLGQERTRNGTFNDAAAIHGHPEHRFLRIPFEHRPTAPAADRGLERAVRRFPFVPDDPAQRDADCFEAYNIQVDALAKRLEASGAATLVIGVSGGLDSTHALIVAAKAFDRLRRPRTDILGFTMPGFATGTESKANAWALMRALGVTGTEIDIRPAARTMLADMGHGFAAGEPLHDVTFENVQAGLRTDYLFRLANQRGGLVLGTGDLSELALGWCTYGVGDQMSHYGVNAGVPKTLIQFLIRWAIRANQYDADTDRVLAAILAQEISPELVPAGPDGRMQSTEDRVGPYALNDFFAHYVIRHGLMPSKVAFLAWHAWRDTHAGAWPADYPDDARTEYDLATIKLWLGRFLDRFFRTSQFKRSALPNGPKVSAGGALSPRGDWRAPSDGTARVYLDELERNVP